MKIGHISDLHLDYNQRFYNGDIWEDTADWLAQQAYDALVISGDIANHVDDVLSFLDLVMEKTGRPVHFVPGNHDLARTREMCSDEVLAKYLNHPSNLIGHPVVYGDVAIAGTLGWYDYSYGPEDITEKEFRFYKEQFCWDAGRIDFAWGDPQMAERHLMRLHGDLSQVTDKKVWLATHFVPYRSAVRFLGGSWDVANAYMGSEAVGEAIDMYTNVAVVSFGHTHTKKGVHVHGQKQLVLNPLGYKNEWTQETYLEELEEQFLVVEM